METIDTTKPFTEPLATGIGFAPPIPPVTKENRPKHKRGRRGRRKAKGEAPVKPSSPYEYVIKDALFGELPVKRTANAWWADRIKLQHVIDAYKFDANDDEACAYAGITLAQLRYFREEHEDFSLVKNACKQYLGLTAKMSLAKKVEQQPEWYLERKRKEEYSTRVEQTGANGRDLYDALATNYNNLLHDVEKHTRDGETGGANAGTDGVGNATSPAEVTPAA